MDLAGDLLLFTVFCGALAAQASLNLPPGRRYRQVPAVAVAGATGALAALGYLAFGPA